jgi:hypothetical protein
MATTTSTTVQQLYADVVADLQAYYDDAVLLPNQAFILNSFDISGQSGSTVRVPLVNTFSDAVEVAEGASIIGTSGAQSNLSPTSANITMTKFGIGTDVSSEALEDGGIGVVRQNVLTRLSRGLAGAVDVKGFATMKAGITQETGSATGANAAFTEHFVCSPEMLGSASKRNPSVSMWYNPNKDATEMRGSVRHGFAVLRPEFGVKVTDRTDSFAAPTANLDNYLQAVALLNQANAPRLADDTYIGFISPTEQYAISKQLSSVNDASIGSLSDIGNRALLSGLIGQAAGITFFSSNNLPDAS